MIISINHETIIRRKNQNTQKDPGWKIQFDEDHMNVYKRSIEEIFNKSGLKHWKDYDLSDELSEINEIEFIIINGYIDKIHTIYDGIFLISIEEEIFFNVYVKNIRSFRINNILDNV